MRETEITVQVYDSTENVKQILEKQGFVLDHHTIMTDWYFSREDTKKLRTMDYGKIIKNSLIIRELNVDGNIKTLLHYKDKELDENGNVITEEKLTEPLQNASNTVRILKAAGFNNWINIVQDMYIYAKGDMHFALQIVPGLGAFIEYEEDESVAGLEPQEKVKLMLEKLKGLGLNLGTATNVKKVYEKFLQEEEIEK